MQYGHRGAPPGHSVVGAIIGEDALRNKGKAIRPADAAGSCAGVTGLLKSRGPVKNYDEDKLVADGSKTGIDPGRGPNQIRAIYKSEDREDILRSLPAIAFRSMLRLASDHCRG
jgi:hypothetical protein